MAKFSITGKPRLGAYIQSRGTKLPTNWKKYTSGGDLALMCLFCPEHHDNIEVQVFPSSMGLEGADACGAYMCESCFIPVKAMEADRSAYRGQASLFNSKELESRIELFVEEFVFKTDVANYYLHLDENWPYENKSAKCYFCGNYYGEDSRVITTPVLPTTVLTGGKIRVCSSCVDLLRVMVPEISLDVLASNFGYKGMACPECGDAYLISSGELEDRDITMTHGKHTCPSCTYKGLRGMTSILLRQPTMYSEDGTLNRFVYAECEYCKEDLDVDLTLVKRYFETKYLSFDNKLMCQDCSQDTSGPIGVLKVNRFFWQIYPTSSPAVYRVLVRSNMGKIYTDALRMGKISDLILNYYEDFKNLPKQVKLNL